MVEVSRLVGFCLLIKRELIDAIGLLDEQFGIGCFEDDDYCLRAITAGFRAVIAGDSFVHHFGSRTFLGSSVDAGSLMRENHARFLAKWSANGNGRNGYGADPHPAFGHPLPASRARVEIAPARVGPGPFAVNIAPEGGLRLRLDLKTPKLSLCMIVRDNARTIGPCLESIRPWVDEMIVVDTGSVDETPRIVEAFGAKLFNLGMTQLHLHRPADAADYLRRSLARSAPHESHVAGRSDTALAESPGDLETLRERSVFFFHHGTDDEGEHALRVLLASDPSDASAYYSLGVVLMRNKRHEEAVVVYRQSLRYRPNYGPTFFNLSYALTDGKRLTEASAACEQAVRLLPNDPGPSRELARIAA